MARPVRDRVRDVCGLYLSRPQNAIVLSVDEKTGIQATERIHADQPISRPGRDVTGVAGSNPDVTVSRRSSPR